MFGPRGWQEYLHWQAHDPKLCERINAILADMMRSPLRGIGKLQPLRENWAGFWPRRITDEHRCIYRVIGSGEAQHIEIAQCRFHYARWPSDKHRLNSAFRLRSARLA